VKSVTLAVALVIAGGCQAYAGLLYSVVDLGALPGGNTSYAYGVNNLGQVAGEAFIAAGQRAFFWDAATGMVDIGVLPGGVVSVAYGINDSGQVVGYSPVRNQMPGGGYQTIVHAFVWDALGGMLDLGPGIAYGINAHGQVVGISDGHAFLWDPKTGMQDLGVLPGYGGSVAYAINNRGHVVGFSQTNFADRAFFGLQRRACKTWAHFCIRSRALARVSPGGSIT
jgi:probable HAF family extracellular repeat protein